MLLLTLALVAALGAADMLPAGLLPDPYQLRPASDQRVPIAVLGDSDSQGYQDPDWAPPGRTHRGGEHAAVTLQWTEVLAKLRPAEVDLGDVGTFGGRRSVVRALELLGCERRAPRKRDHQHNFAFSTAGCQDLVEGVFRQAPRLVALMDRDPERWRRGVVVVRIGICNLGGEPELAAMARDPAAPELVQRIRSCTDHIAAAVGLVHARHPATKVVLVGILDNADYPPHFDRWRSAAELRNIGAALDRFDGALRALAEADPRITFVDDRDWFRKRWGGRGPDGAPAYRTVAIGSTIRVQHAMGDPPTNSVLADGHAGLVWNTLWCQSLVEVLGSRLGLPVRPIPDAEVERFLAGLLAAPR